MSRIHGLARTHPSDLVHNSEYDLPRDNALYQCFCGRIFYSEKEFRDHVNNYG